MEQKQQFWPNSDRNAVNGFVLEARAHLALQFVEFSAAGSPAEDVGYAFALADAFVDEAIRRGELRAFTEADLEAGYERVGRLAALRERGKARTMGKITAGEMADLMREWLASPAKPQAAAES